MTDDARTADLEELRHCFEATGNVLYAWVAIRVCLASARGGPRLPLPAWVLDYLARGAEDISDLGRFIDPRRRPRQIEGESDHEFFLRESAWYFGVPGKGERDWSPELPAKGTPAAKLARDALNRPVEPERVLRIALQVLGFTRQGSNAFQAYDRDLARVRAAFEADARSSRTGKRNVKWGIRWAAWYHGGHGSRPRSAEQVDIEPPPPEAVLTEDSKRQAKRVIAEGRSLRLGRHRT